MVVVRKQEAGARKQETGKEIGSHGHRVLKKLAEGGTLVAQGEGFRIGTTPAPASLVAALKRADLIRQRGEGYVLSDPGRAWLSRRAAKPGEDAAYGQNRLLRREARKVEGQTQVVTVNSADSPLAWLARRGLISERQMSAADRLRGDFTLAGQGPRVTMRWEAVPQSRSVARGAPGALDATPVQVNAKRRFRVALEAVGPGLSDVLWRVACAGEGLETAEKAMGWPARAAKVVLGLALDRLADHYGLK